MKKKTTVVNQPDKTETIKAELLNGQALTPKMYRDHAHYDHSHGRVNRFPFGSNLGPSSF